MNKTYDGYQEELDQHRRQDAGRYPEYQGTVEFQFLDIKATCNAYMLVGAKAYYHGADVSVVMEYPDAVRGWALALAGAFILRDGYPMLCRARCRLGRVTKAPTALPEASTGLTRPGGTSYQGRLAARHGVPVASPLNAPLPYIPPSGLTCPEPGCTMPTAFPSTDEPRCLEHIHTNDAKLRAAAAAKKC